VALKLTAAQLGEMRRHGESAYPHEACGLMGGTAGDEERRVARLVSIPNAREDSPQNRYLIEPEAFRRAQQALAEHGHDVIGVYHSHPDHPARPSAFDQEHAWPRLSYVIVAVAKGSAQDVRSWVLADDRDQFAEEPIITEERVAT
jgi:proteasome lid subunit RPN8/RPN11